ncbi:glycosyltransferase [Enterobacter kobei]|uniref:glycosyltransferase n=1 Tax=Enterobacter kobei TaxID=208224 RepID=UPI00063AE374|nr:glycosyltransferase [Enterobacter kobei]KLG25041.1 glycosyl transferase family 2 [Enterobacter kobei]MCF1288082.1 glycosyltransferase [Enterobacter kobei]MCO4129162.1 glycosyltransferase [Enterobacter kobei]MCO4186139.1 glycosyltransferase [Enterobacter kobei]MCS4600821.1 glycosyltransferase [Enterobacter kobei]
MENKISLLVNSLNEFENLKKNIIPLVSYFDEVIIIDMESNDGSRELFENIDNANFIEVAKMGYVEPARKVGIDACKNDYIFILDADEYPSKKIIEELVNFQSAKGESSFDGAITGGVLIPRLNRMFEKEIVWGKFAPDNDRQLRFFKRDSVLVSDVIHAGLRFRDEISSIKTLSFDEGYYLYHYHSSTAFEFISRLVRYSEFEGFRDKGDKSFNVKKAIKAFLREYIAERGCLHGKVGFALAYILSLRAFLKGS